MFKFAKELSKKAMERKADKIQALADKIEREAIRKYGRGSIKNQPYRFLRYHSQPYETKTWGRYFEWVQSWLFFCS